MAVKITGEIIKPFWHLYNRDDRITVFNGLDHDFQFGAEGHEYIVKQGDKTEIPGYMANLYVKAMVNEMMSVDGKHLQMTDQAQRQEYVDKIVLNVSESLAPGIEEVGEPTPTVLPTLTGDMASANFGAADTIPNPDSGVPVGITDAEAFDKAHPENLESNLKPVPNIKEPFPSLKPQRTRPELLKSAKAMGLDVVPTDTVVSLTEKIKQAL